MKVLHIFLFIVIVALLSGSCKMGRQKELNVIFQAMYYPDRMSKLAIEFEKKTGIKVNMHYFDYDHQYDEIVKSIHSSEPMYDICLMDLVWTREFAEKRYCLDLTREVNLAELSIPHEVIDPFIYSDKIYAIPFIVDFLSLYFNTDHIKKAGFDSPPASLEQMVEQMKAIKRRGIVKYPWHDSWTKSELLICEFVWFTAAFGGELFDAEGKPMFHKGAGLKALKFMKMLLDEELVNPQSLKSGDIMVRESFLKEQSTFTSNWFLLSRLVKDPAVSDVVEFSEMGLLPVSRGVEGKYTSNAVSISGFEGLAILSNSNVKQEAWQYIQFITSQKIQSSYFNHDNLWYNTLKSQETAEKDPYAKLLSKQLRGVLHRPVILNYVEVSGIMQKYIYRALEGKIEPEEALNRAVQEIELIKK